MPSNFSIAAARARISRRLKAITEECGPAVLEALKKEADDLVAFQKRLVPVKSGELRDSIEAYPLTKKLGYGVSAGDAKAYYARWVEFGTSKTQAEPFFYPAYRANRKKIRAATRKAVKDAVRGSKNR